MRLHESVGIPVLNDRIITYLIGEREQRLLTERHFRGKNRVGAGNFRDWDTVTAAFYALHDALEPYVVKTIQELMGDGGDGNLTDSVELTLPRPIGWACTSPLERFSGERFEIAPLSSRRTGWMVPASRRDLLAPPTNRVTAIYRVSRDRYSAGWCCILLNLRPGEDLDADEGDMTEQTGLVFYPFGHPGEPLDTNRASP